MPLGTRGEAHVDGQRADHLERPPLPPKCPCQVQEPRTLRIDGQPLIDGSRDLCPEFPVRLQLPRENLWKPAPNVESGDSWKMRVLQGVDVHQLRARLLQRLQVLWIVEAERLVPDDAQPHEP